MEIEIGVTKNFKYLQESQKWITVLEGSSRSSKTYSVLLWILMYAFSNKNKIITIARENLVVCRRTVMEDFLEILNMYKLPFQSNKSENYFIINSNKIRFVGLDDINKVHGLKQDILYVNEGLNIEKEFYLQLFQRTIERIIIDYNPYRVEHFIYDWIDTRDDIVLYRTNIFDNQFAPDNAKKQILGYEPTPENIANGTANEFYWNVYGLGLRFKGSDVIIPNFSRYSVEPTEKEVEWTYYGGDFGYTDPTTLIKVSKVGNSLFCRVLFYERGLTNQEIAARILPLVDLNIPQVWDCAEPKSIQELRVNNLPAIPANKKVSVYFGLQKIRQFNLLVYKDALSNNLATELANLRYLTDSSGNIVLNAKGYPMIKNTPEHCIDPIRYILTKFNIDK